ncbi:thioredoxin family protein [Limibaculum sp. M0105]|uniref:Thioredoxin family protein n=1 Tax=Thermohalobaculum xanthum TaxID=2753746 RepID=A0A8J7SCM3_9RHOB|nr:thioredoxin family protein [Thermohalobaculum xanthum]MBK0398341.1 thioredoxin family protein [Thermohalobaculum xanthum]
MNIRSTSIAALFAALAAALPGIATPAAADVRLVMVEQPGCVWCVRWDAEVGDAYALTTEGRVAPLHRVNLHSPLPDGFNYARPPVFTPTFILFNDGAEVGRIEGYPGEDFFWPLLARLIEGLPAEKQEVSKR